MKSDLRRQVDELRSQDKFVFANKREGSQLRRPTRKEADFLEALRPSARTTMARQLLSMPPAAHFQDDVPEQPQVGPTELTDEDIVSYLDVSVLFDKTKSLAQIISDERQRLASLPRQATPQDLDKLNGLNPAARIAEARRLGIL